VGVRIIVTDLAGGGAGGWGQSWCGNLPSLMNLTLKSSTPSENAKGLLREKGISGTSFSKKRNGESTRTRPVARAREKPGRLKLEELGEKE